MKISLKDTKKGKYLAQPGKWTDNPDAAKAFPDEETARYYFTLRKLSNIAIVKLADPGDAQVAASKPPPLNKSVRQKILTLAPEQTKKPEPEASGIQPAQQTIAMLVASTPETKAKLTQTSATSTDNPIVKKRTMVEANVDVGYGNAVFIRGQGAGLNWEKGQPLNCINGTTWVWSSEKAEDKAVFKLLLNDQVWARGGDLVVEPGKVVAVTPAF